MDGFWKAAAAPQPLTGSIGIEHFWIFVLSFAAWYFYYKGSKDFYYAKTGFLLWLGLGVFVDIFMAVAASTRILPVLLPGEGIPYSSILFLMHMIMAGIGLVGYALIYLIILIFGKNRKYRYMKFIAYRVLLPVWTIGVAIAIVNFMSKAILQTNIYSLF